ncbi:MAG TPA: glycosyltransferase family 39 protein [Thermoanaerobaculia bacterium]|jgi:hypothetical protein
MILAVKTAGLRAAYWISPLLTTLALLGVFLLGREIAGSFAGLLAMIAMAASPATLNEVNDPDSHANSLCCTTWGMLLLLRWWRTGRLHHAALAGLLLGYSTIIRYTEGLLLLPIALVVLFRCGRRPDRRALGGAAANPELDAADGLRFATRRLALWRGPGEERADGEREPGGADWQLLEVTAAPRAASIS